MNIFKPALAYGVLLLIPCASSAQSSRTLIADAVFSEGFGMVSGLHELSDGRLMITDGLGQMLLWVEMDGGRMEQIGREGRGPEEYRTPDALYALAGDSTLMVDLGNGRLTVLGPDGEFIRTMPIARQVNGQMVTALPRGVDRMGRIYFQPFGMMMGRPGGGVPAPPDSASIARWNPADDAVDTLGVVKLEERKVETSGGANNRSVRIRPVRMSPQDAWAVAPDGRVAVARSDPYSLEWIGDGSHRQGSQVSIRPVRVGRPEKIEYLLTRRRGDINVMVDVNNGVRQMSFGRGRRNSDEVDISGEWPLNMPAFGTGAVRVAPNGDAWVRRNISADDEATFDVFGPDGNLKEQIKLPVGRHVVGFGDGVVYAVYFDEFDLQYLERYPM